MNLKIETDPSLTDTEVLIRCTAVTERIAALVASIRMHDAHLVGKSKDETVVIPIGTILYVETVDRKTFAYTPSAVVELKLRVSELEDQLVGANFVRAGKSCLINLCRVKSLRPYVGGRLLARLDNDEEVIISRKYAKEIKHRLGL